MTTNSKEHKIAAQLREHVFGNDGPTESLINEGRFPHEWASKYLELLNVATKQWQHQQMWPRELVAAIHFASWYLDLRYDAWCSSNPPNKTTERELAAIRSTSELFLMHGSVETDVDAT